MKTHTISCKFPEGCSCGASEWNRMEDDLRSAQRRAQKYLNALNALASNGVLSESTIEHYVHEEDAKLRRAEAACPHSP